MARAAGDAAVLRHLIPCRFHESLQPNRGDRPCCSILARTGVLSAATFIVLALPPPRFCLPAAYREEDLMPRRGSAQFLLLFLRSRARLGWTMGAVACALIVAVLLQAGGEFPLLTPDRACASCSAKAPGSMRWPGCPRPRRLAMGQHHVRDRRGGAAAWLKRVGRQGDGSGHRRRSKPVAARTRMCRAPSSARWASATASPSPPPTARRASIASPAAGWSIRIWRRPSPDRRTWMRRWSPACRSIRCWRARSGW